MRVGISLIAVASLVGCAAKPVVVERGPAEATMVRYEEATSAALVFTPPVTLGDPPVELSREDRMPSAFVSFEGPSTTLYWIHTDDLQESEWGNDTGNGMMDRFRRRAVIDKTGVTYR